MPTSHVLPESTELLQDIADALWKAKKVLVVTGAGISTNSGIPDFRSKNGLYSLIQAQFDAASKEFNEPGMETIEDDETEPTNKRQRRSEDRQDNAESDSEDTASSSQPTLSSQSSFASNRSTLPVMKGRDLFDASIWADPVKTSVFYTFATTLRQKVREVVPTRSHEFISHLRNTNKLVRCYTQNIDEIEEKVGLSTSLGLGPGKKGRFSTRSARASAGSTIASKGEGSQDSPTVGKEQESQEPSSSQDSQGSEDSSASQSQTDTKVPKNGDPCFRGVECVFLHGSLRLLRCFRCGQTTPWDEAGRELETMSGRQPSCPRCAGATAAREGRGKRALAVGKLRPDIVLYGEEHPNAHLISPIVQHDISLTPDMLLILGTSLKVHGLKVLVREFAKAVHSRGGKVVFVNFTKPPESVWSDVIDYWPVTEKEATRKKRSRTGRPLNPDAKWPAATRDDQTNGAITVFKIVQTLGQISGRQTDEMPAKPTGAVPRKRRPKQRHSAPGELENVLSTCPPPTSTSAASEQTMLSLPELLPSTTIELAVAQTAVLPNDRTELTMPLADISTNILPNLTITSRPLAGPGKYSILSAVKANPRRRQSKKIFEGGSSGPGGPLWTEVQTKTPKQQQQQQRKQADARGRSKSMGVQASLDPPIAAATPSPNTSPVDTAWSATDRIAQQLMMDLSGSSFPAYSSREPPINCSSPAPLPSRETMQLPLPTGHRQSLPVDNSQAPTMQLSSNPTVLPPIRKIFPELQPRWPPENTFFFQDPLGSRYSYPPQRPQQEWSCTDQLVREADEQLKAVVIHRQQQ
ncbi:hypothetical protein HMPREF1624_02448 [Sporothrix schenckii ATCC 58251]|uniref:Deacetylase sirtuin-type domain-containing protein n=1 Tax=Sporothrix schenckii (strain ATCC 58251 / de Perez 2211183) TaxID=1391915 RepID=U7Q3B2_SPOS1|nr:hypothetical protein HMPREF1624_02448 [Sporothrix schenckii ATCC 58251]